MLSRIAIMCVNIIFGVCTIPVPSDGDGYWRLHMVEGVLGLTCALLMLITIIIDCAEAGRA